MFFISKDNFRDIELEQFKLFEIEGGKLPSFSVSLFNINDIKSIQLTIDKVLGDYVFYKKTNIGYWISFKNSFVCINDTLDTANIYLADKAPHDSSFEFSYLLMQAYMYRLVSTGNLMMHAAATVFQGQAILFCGVSGAGKSTQANLWKKYLRCNILNYDKPCVILEDNIVYAHGSPWSGKEKMFHNKYVPLKAIVYVVQSKINTVRRLSTAEAMSHIYLHNYVYPLSQTVEDDYLSVINKTATLVPVYELKCDISEQAVITLFNEIFKKEKYLKVRKMYIMKYKVKDCFEMKRIAEEYIVIPRGTTALDFKASVVFNESGAFLWNLLLDYKDENELAVALYNKYNIDKKLAQNDVKAFLIKMQKNNMLDILEG